MYQRGDRVLVEGFRGKRATLYVWKPLGEQGLVLCTEDGYRRRMAGDEDAPAVGFPMTDIRGRAEDGEKSAETQGY